MIHFTLIARITDGLILCGSGATTYATGIDNIEKYKHQAKQITSTLDNAKGNSKMMIDSGDFYFSLLLDQNICYLVLTDRNYPNKLSFSFLEDIKTEFLNALYAEYQDNWRNQIDTASRIYQFIKHDKLITEKRKEYMDVNSMRASAKLNSEVEDISSIMRQNVQQLLNRGEKLDNIRQTSSRMVDESKKYKNKAKKLAFQALIQQYIPVAVVAIIVVFMLLWMYYF